MKSTAYAYLEDMATRAYNVSHGHHDTLRKTVPDFPEKSAKLRAASAIWKLVREAYERRAPWIAEENCLAALLAEAHQAAARGGMESEDPKILAKRLIKDFKSAVGTDLNLRAEGF